ncbi:MAG: Maf family nucleotide pyrophosphatase [Sediminibacterium sp.]|nr:MAG: septum formation [Chitinophagaceae bacterium]MDP1844820.1 Maf family nucleotide pyrophosphatase [Sediminibacterium sp.]
MKEIILASQSPRRKQLLEWAEIPFSIVVKSTDESFSPSLDVTEVPIFIALEKALAVSEYLKKENKFIQDQIILAADTIVVLGNTVINKPVDRADAIAILNSLSGKEHRVITGVVMKKGEEEHSFSEVTNVTFHTLSQEQIEYYVDQYKPYDKAGAYAIQEWIGVIGIASIHGDFYNVMGLPVSRVVQLLNKLNS